MNLRKILFLKVFLCSMGFCAAAVADTPAIAAASDLKFALEAVAVRFHADTRQEVRLSFGSSGNYFRQIGQGAPFQLFLSADEDFVLRLHQAGKTEDRGVLYATGRIVLFAPHGSPLQVDAQMAGLKAAIAAGSIRRFAIANPEHAPYGRAAEQALHKLGLWEGLRGRLVLGENVSQAAQFAASGSTQGGIFAYSLALAPVVARQGRYILLPENLHQPLRQRMALVKGAGANARDFYAYLQQPAARKVLEQYGFAVPGAAK
ncbi:MAG: molybdate ABC transporter substrate-binding protein [Betaproteobacteria bacterium]|jgi:molybdate transport system substrate-binding protein|nr:molybdate ABC transporter substrate-binding protein [Betaproteobacteria bacterium]